MNISSWDFTLIAVMTAWVVIVSLLFPALGLTAQDVQQDDIPEYNSTEEKFEFAPDFVENPIRPDRGYLNHSSNEFDDFRGKIQDNIGEDENGNRTQIVAIENDTVHLTDVSVGGNGVFSTHTFTSDGENATLSGQGFTVKVKAVDIREGHGEFEYAVTERPSDSSFFASLFNFVDGVAQVIGFFVINFIIMSQKIVQGFLNLGQAGIDIGSYFVQLMQFLISGYFASVDAAPGYAKLILTVPGVALFYEFAKMGVIIGGVLRG